MLKICVNQINVHNMDVALAFYSGKLGFQIETKDFYPNLVPLKHDGIHLVLCQVEKPSLTEYGKTAQSLINFQTPDLALAMTNLKSSGVEFVHNTPQPCPVGLYAAFKDPSGNVHELLEFSK